jgi:hypothetical protein
MTSQEGWLAKHAVSEDDRAAGDTSNMSGAVAAPDDPMQGLDELDVAGPRPE